MPGRGEDPARCLLSHAAAHPHSPQPQLPRCLLECPPHFPPFHFSSLLVRALDFLSHTPTLVGRCPALPSCACAPPSPQSSQSPCPPCSPPLSPFVRVCATSTALVCHPTASLPPHTDPKIMSVLLAVPPTHRTLFLPHQRLSAAHRRYRPATRLPQQPRCARLTNNCCLHTYR